MKRICSFVVAVIMMLSTCFASAIPTFAAGYVGSIETTGKSIIIEVTVNNEDSIYGTYETVDNPIYSVVVDFSYTGEDPLSYWEVPDLIEGVDYVIIDEEGNNIKIGIINPSVDVIWANAITGNVGTTKKPNSVEVDKNHKSPNTGVGFASVFVVAGAGILVACARKKKN